MPGKIYAAMAAIMKDTDAIGKDQRNQSQGFQYRGIDDIYNAMHGVLAKHGVFMTPEVLDKQREERTNAKGTVLAFTTLRIKYTFWADDGSSVSCIVEGEGMDSGDKSSNKALAIGHKYALLQTFCIPTAEQKDPDAECHEVKPPATKQLTEEQLHYKTVMAEINAARTVDDVNAVLKNRQSWLKDMPIKGYDAAVLAADKKREELAV